MSKMRQTYSFPILTANQWSAKLSQFHVQHNKWLDQFNFVKTQCSSTDKLYMFCEFLMKRSEFLLSSSTFREHFCGKHRSITSCFSIVTILQNVCTDKPDSSEILQKCVNAWI